MCLKCHGHSSRHFNKKPKMSTCLRHLRTKQENTPVYIGQSLNINTQASINPGRLQSRGFHQANKSDSNIFPVCFSSHFQRRIQCCHSLLNTLRFCILFIVQNCHIHHCEGNYHFNIAKLVISLPHSSQPLWIAYSLKARQVLIHTRKSLSRDCWHLAIMQKCSCNPPHLQCFAI